MTVIKAGQTGRLLQSTRTIDLSDHLREAGGVVQAARRQEANIIGQAQRRAVEIKERAHQEGFAQGHVLGLKEGKQTGHEKAYAEACERFAGEQAALVTVLQGAANHIDATKENLAIEAERHLLDFAVDVARRLTFAVGRLHRESAVANLRRAIDLVGTRTDLTIRVHPDDLESMRTFAESTFKCLEASPSVEIVAEPSMAPGGCRVESVRTNIDAGLETQVDEMLKLFLGEKR